MRAEIKANYLLRNSDDLRRFELGAGARRIIYRAHMQQVERLPARAFAVVVDKRKSAPTPAGCFDLAWEALLQRLERTSTTEKATFAVVHDEGENDSIRRWVRKARRYLTAGSAFGTGSFQHAARLLVDDPCLGAPITRTSSKLLTSSRTPPSAPSPGIARVCPPGMWDEIGAATHRAVSGLKPRSKPGIVLRR